MSFTVNEDTDCPSCERDDFVSQRGMHIHHKSVHDESLANVEVDCGYCGETLTRRAIDVGRQEDVFCNHHCYGRYSREI